MAQAPDTRSSLGASLMASGAEARHRELATEHMLFQTLVFIERLGDHASDETTDDEAVREVARLFVQSLRKSAG